MVTGLLLKRKVLSALAFGWLAGSAFVPRFAAGSESELTAGSSAMRVWRNADGNGLPSDSVTTLLQTRDGFLWVGTTLGLARFDGVKFTERKLVFSPTNHPMRITALCEDTQGHLWIGTQQSGLFELAQGKVRHFTRDQGLLDDYITSLAAGDKGLVWLGTKSGLNLWTGERFQSFTVEDGLSDEFVASVNVARSGAVWITTRVGMCRFLDGHITPFDLQTKSQGRSPEYLGAYEDRRGNLWAFGDTYLINLAEGKRFNYFRNSESTSVRIWSLCEGRDGRLWIGTSGRGLFCFEDNSFQPVPLAANRWPYDVRALCEDNEANLWLGTFGGGLIQLRPQSVHVLRAGQGLPASPPTALALENGRVYVGVERGGLYVGESGRFDRAATGEGLGIRNFVSCVCVAPDGTAWAGTLGSGLYSWRNGQGLHFTTANGLSDDTVLAVLAEKEGAIWLSTSAGGLQRFDGQRFASFNSQHGLPTTPITVISPSLTGGLWLGTQDGVICAESNRTFTLAQPPQVPGAHCILALHEGEAHRLWIGTAGGGLSCFANGICFNWTLTNGLPSDVVAGVIEDNAKNLWLATDAGIFRISRRDVRRSLDDARVPLACQFISDAKTVAASAMISGGTRAVLSPEGALWFATSDGVLNVDTRQPELEPTTFPICLENASFNGSPPLSLLRGPIWASEPSASGPLKAPVHLRSLEIRFTALNFAAPEEIRFRHKLEGLDSDWVDDAGLRVARYGTLLYGRYRFRLAARRADGPWQEAADAFAFVVPTPLYFQTWAICLYALAGIALVAGTVRMVSHRRLRFALARLEQQQTLERERMRIARDMHDEMGSKLTKISFLSEHVQVAAGSQGPVAERIEQIAVTSRDLLKTMDEIVWVVNPVNDTLENLTTYLSHYAVEYFQNTTVECSLRLPPEIPHYPLSSEARHNLFLTFEEILNNVLKHSGACHVKVEMGIRNHGFELTVADDGKGFEVPPVSSPNGQVRRAGGGNGLRNMRQRLSAIGGECLISSRPGAGTCVTLRFGLGQESSTTVNS